MSPRLQDELRRFIDPQQLFLWCRTPNPVLRGETPKALIDRGEEGPIFEALERLKNGGH